jgi:hypothetical protein
MGFFIEKCACRGKVLDPSNDLKPVNMRYRKRISYLGFSFDLFVT